MGSYMLLLWAPKQLLAKPRSADEARESNESWRGWHQALTRAGHDVTGAQLDSGARCVTGAEKRVVDGAFSPDHTVGGYYVVSASSLEEATDLAKGCPLLRSGGTVEVRPLMTSG
jgi:hypothetical protein